MLKLAIALGLVVACMLLFAYFFPKEVKPLLEVTGFETSFTESTPMYKWQDGEGRWQVTDTPPPEGIPFELKQYPHDANLLPLPQALREKD